MVKFLLNLYLHVFFIFFSNMLFAEKSSNMPSRLTRSHLISTIKYIDTASINTKHATKICSCQILVLQTSYRRQKNFALFAERTNKKSFASDLSFANRVIEREKRHMQSFFYDKLEVVGTISDAVDCKSMYKRLKTKNKALYLYDILDADIRR
jgi:hypothetical protein